MDSESRNQVANTERLKTLACNVKFSEGNTLLHQFVLDNSYPNHSGSENYVNAVLLSMSDVPGNVVNALNDYGCTALHLAVLKNHLLMVKKLLSCLRNIDVNARCVRKVLRCENTALHLAAALGHVSIIQVLLDKGANMEITDVENYMALCFDAMSKHVRVMKWFVSTSVNQSCGWGTPLCRAARLGKLEALTLLVSSGAEISYRGLENPLCCAAQSGSLATVQFLVSNGADVHAGDFFHDTPLHYAAYSGSLDIVEYLVSNRAYINDKNIYGETPLHSVVRGRNLECAALLIGQGADLEATCVRGSTPLHYAIESSNLEIVKLLIDKGADLNSVDAYGSTPLHYAVSSKSLECAKFLLDQGANFKADMEGWTPLHAATLMGHVEMIRALLTKGADVNARDKRGKTPLDLAREEKNQSCVDALQSVGQFEGSTAQFSV